MSEKKPVRHFRYSKKGREIVRRSRARNAQMQKPKRHVRWSVVIIAAAAAVSLLLALTVPPAVTSSRLKKLGYRKSTIALIKELKLTSTILDHSYYSSFLADAIDDNTLNTDYIQLYTVVPEDYGLNDASFLLYQRLADKGYEEDQLQNLFSKLQFWEMTPLLVLDYQWDESQYIEECTAHRDTNSTASFTLDSAFLTPYKVTAKAYDPDTQTVLVNLKYALSADFAPQLTVLSTQYASDNVQLSADAAAAFEQMSQAGVEAGNAFFASDGYRSYEDVDSVYQACAAQYGDDADTNCLRAGHDERQTGLDVTIAPTYESYDNFPDTKVHQWLSDNAASYGFIERYPAAKSSVTCINGETNVYRYVGADLAAKIRDSGLTYDEYYSLYLKPWNDRQNLPSNAILSSTGAVNTVEEEQAEE